MNFDLESLKRRLDCDLDLIREIIGIFFEDYPKDFERLKQAVRGRDLSEAKRVAHTLKGSFANVGGMRASQIAAEMEKSAALGREPELGQALEELQAAFELYRAEAQGFLDL